MLILNIENRYTKMKNSSRKIVRLLQEVTSYQISGSHFSRSFRNRIWDGKEKLLKFNRKTNRYYFPTGLLADVVDKLKECGIRYKLKDKRKRPKKINYYSWNKKIKLRPYQIKAKKRLLKKNENGGSLFGSGIVKMPIRSGKTKTAARIIKALSVKTLFIVPSKILLHQTKESLEDSLLCEVGLIGDGFWEEKEITVATAQTLSRRMEEAKPKDKNKRGDASSLLMWRKFISNYDCVIFDEAHHLTAETWHRVMMELNAYYKIGLSATAFPDMEKQWEKGAIWLKACCGRIKVDITTSYLIRKGYLVGPTVKLYEIEKPHGLRNKKWSQELRNEAIYENKYRNKKIAKIAKKYIEKGLLVLVVTNRLNQVSILSDLFDRKKINHYTVTSKDSSQIRKQKVKDFVEHSVQALIGTVLSEGVDIPEIDVVINAEGGADIKTTIQRMRNLTVSENKDKAYVIDFLDLTNKYFKRHSRERLKVYENEDAFKVRVLKP